MSALFIVEYTNIESDQYEDVRKTYREHEYPEALEEFFHAMRAAEDVTLTWSS